MHPPPPDAGVAMDFGQNSLFGYMEDLQELTIIERPVRRSLKVRGTERRSPQGCPPVRLPFGAPAPVSVVTAAASELHSLPRVGLSLTPDWNQSLTLTRASPVS